MIRPMPDMDVAEPALKRLIIDELLAGDGAAGRRSERLAGGIVAVPPMRAAYSVLEAGCATAGVELSAAS